MFLVKARDFVSFFFFFFGFLNHGGPREVCDFWTYFKTKNRKATQYPFSMLANMLLLDATVVGDALMSGRVWAKTEFQGIWVRPRLDQFAPWFLGWIEVCT